MSKKLSRILSAILLLCMLPATVLTALAGGYGVAYTDTENQYWDNANGQYIPQLITVDGDLADSGWVSSDWNHTNDENSTWDSTSPAEQNLGASYAYQLKLDDKYFYAAAVITMPEGVTTGDYNIFLSEQKVNVNTANNRGCTGGFVFSIDTAKAGTNEFVTVVAKKGGDEEAVAAQQANVDKKYEYENYNGTVAVTETLTDNGGRSVLSIAGEPDKYGPYGENGTIPELEAYQLAAKYENGVIIIEFRNRIWDTYDNDMKTDYNANETCGLSYYLGLSLANANAMSGNGYDVLYSPLYSRNNVNSLNAVPTAENWPGGGNEVEIDDNKFAIYSLVEPDGQFNEALWAGYTDFYQAHSDNVVDHVETENKELLDFSNVGYIKNNVETTAVTQDKTSTNVTKGKSYTTSPAAQDSYPDTNKTELTNGTGTTKTDASDPSWSGYLGDKIEIEVNLAGTYLINEAQTRMLTRTGSGIYRPDITVYYKHANGEYRKFGYAAAPAQETQESGAINQKICIKSSGFVIADKIKFVFDRKYGSWIFCNEVIALGYKLNYENLVSGNPYTYSGATIDEQNPDGNRTMLTDGVIGLYNPDLNDNTSAQPVYGANNLSGSQHEDHPGDLAYLYESPEFIHANASGTTQFPALTIVMPLGDGNLNDLYEVVLSTYDNGNDLHGISDEFITNVYYSTDYYGSANSSWTHFGTNNSDTSKVKRTNQRTVTSSGGTSVKARQIKLVISGDWAVLSEIQAFGKKDPNPEYMAKYDIRADENYLYGAILTYDKAWYGVYANGGTVDYCNSSYGAEYKAKATTTNGKYRWVEFKIPLSVLDPTGDGFTYQLAIGTNASNSVATDWITVTPDQCVGTVSDTIVVDGEVDEGHWVAVRAADNKFDGVGRTGSDYRLPYGNVDHFAYDLKADGTYIYGSAVVVFPDGWTDVSKNTAINRDGDMIRFTIAPGTNTNTCYNFEFYRVTDPDKDQYQVIRSMFARNGSVANGSAKYDDPSVQFSLEIIDNGDDGDIAVLEFVVDIAKFNATVVAKDNPIVINGTSVNDVYFHYTADVHKGMHTGIEPMYTLLHTYHLENYDGLSNIFGSEIYPYANKVTYADFVPRVAVDGYIDEDIWLEKMTHVDMTNGSYAREPFDGFGLAYDYKTYTVGNYMYGAVIVDEVGNDKNRLAFNVWFDNYVDERDLMQERLNATYAKYNNVPVEYQIEQREYEIQTYTSTGTFSTDGKTVLTKPTAGAKKTIYKDELIYYPNHQYSFKLFGDQYDNNRKRADGTSLHVSYDVNPEAAPDYYAHYDGTTDGNGRIKTTHIVKQNGVQYEYQYKVFDGKTYLEFKVDLTSVRCHNTDFRFFVSLYYNYSAKNTGYELFYPKTGVYNDDGSLTVVEPAWIFDNKGTSNDTNSEYSNVNGRFEIRAASGRLMKFSDWENQKAGYGYHTLAVLGAEDFANNKYKVLAIVNDTTEYNVKYGNEYGYQLVRDAAAKATGGNSNAYIYAVDSGTYVAKNNYTTIHSKYYTATEDVDLTNFRAYEAISEIELGWNVGDLVEFDFGTTSNGTKITQSTLSVSNNYYIKYYGRLNDTTKSDFWTANAVYLAGLVQTKGTIITKLSTSAYVNDKTYNVNDSAQKGESRAIYCPYTVKRTISIDRMEYAYERTNTYMPEFDKYGYQNTWMYGSTKKVTFVQHIAPEKVDVDGNLGDTAWTEEGWNHVDPNVNGMSSGGEGTSFKYQFRTDGDYLYVAAVIDAEYDDDTYFRLWINGDGSKSFSRYYQLGGGSTTLTGVEIPGSTGLTEAEDKFAEGANGATYNNGELVYNTALSAVVNNAKDDPNDLNDVTVLGYGASDLYGWTNEILESTSDGNWVWEARPQTQGFRFGNDHGVIGSDADLNVINVRGTGAQTLVEFKIPLDEFGGRDGFQYYVEASGGDGKTIYPRHQREAASETNYAEYYHPSWVWDTATAVTIELLDLVPSSKLWLTNDYAPVTSIGAKINANYNNSGYAAIRFGARYTESFIREITTAENATYWDVEDMGIVFLPYHLVCGGQELTIDNASAKVVSAQDIINWKNDAPDAKTNFADYESFVFYANLVGIPEAAYNMEFMYRGYVDYYGKVTGPDTFYGAPLARSYAGVSNNGYSKGENDAN